MKRSAFDVEKIRGWIKDMGGADPTAVPDPATNWHLVFPFPPGNPMGNQLTVLNPRAMPRAVILATKTAISPEHLAAFNDLDNEGREAFLQELVAVLSCEEVEYALEHDPHTRVPTSFQISAVRYDDGLTLDYFARTAGAVFKRQLAAVQVVRRHLGMLPPAGGSEFEFRKLGVQ